MHTFEFKIKKFGFMRNEAAVTKAGGSASFCVKERADPDVDANNSGGEKKIKSL